MSRPTVSPHGKLDTSVNVPVAAPFKKFLVDTSKKLPGRPPHTRVARVMLELYGERIKRDGVTELANALAS